MTLILASGSSARRALLAAAGVPCQVIAPLCDEEREKALLRRARPDPVTLALGLAAFKARDLSRAHPDALILGCDQMLALPDGSTIDKARDPDEAAAILRRLSGGRHQLHSAAVILADSEEVWRAVETVTLDMRRLSDAFIAAYLGAEWEHVRHCVGCYRIEGPGVQLFSAIAGTQFAIQGLPLLGLLDFLRGQGVLAT